MVRVAILADIHGNLPAYEAVRRDIAAVAPDIVVVDGDIINRGPQSKECLAAVRAEGWPVVFGNHEEYILKFESGDLPDEFFSDLWLPTRRVWEELSVEEIAYLRTLPLSWRVDVPTLPAIRIVHGSPRALTDGLGPYTPEADLQAIARAVDELVLVGAHTHRPFDRQVGHTRLMNCGAVGVPFNGDPRAQYLVLTGQGGRWQADFRCIDYDRRPVYEAWAQTDVLQRSVVGRIFQLEIETAHFHLGRYFYFCDEHGFEKNDPKAYNQYRACLAQNPAWPRSNGANG